MFIHAGDLCRRGSLDELEVVGRWLSSLPHQTRIVVAGNHDWAFVKDPVAARRLLGPGVIYLEDSGVVVEGVRFWGSPWQPAFNDWAFNLPRGEPLREKWALIPADTDVLVTHGPPHGIGDGTGTGDGAGGYGAHRSGCEALRARVSEVLPMLHLFGHIHDSGGVWAVGPTVFANVTTWECERAPTVLDIDPHRRRVVPIEVPPARP